MNAPIRAVIADDEPLARGCCVACWPRIDQISVVAEARDGAEAGEVVRRLLPDLLLLDVQMPNADGFTVLKDLPEKPVVVFITAHADHALRAFDLDADRLCAQAVRRRSFRARHDASEGRSTHPQPGEARAFDSRTDDAGPASPPCSRIASPERRTTRRDGRIRDIDWIEAADYYAQVHVRGVEHLIRESLQEFETRLGTRRFLRIHRGALVNSARIQRLERLEDSELMVVLLDGTKLRVSRSRRQHVAQVLGAR